MKNNSTSTTNTKHTTPLQLFIEVVCVIGFIAILSVDWEHVLIKIGL